MFLPDTVKHCFVSNSLHPDSDHYLCSLMYPDPDPDFLANPTGSESKLTFLMTKNGKNSIFFDLLHQVLLISRRSLGHLSGENI
jgi:hypothetical protein